MFKNPFDPSIGENDLIKHKYGIYHSCPFCKKECSVDRLVPWLASSCINDGKAEFPCDTCGEYVVFPKEAFVESFLASVSEQDHERPNVIKYNSDGSTIIGQKTPRDILKERWFEIFLEANTKGPKTIDQIYWDGTGTCPGCGKDRPQYVSQNIECISCKNTFNVNQNDISKEIDTNIICPKCNMKMIIPQTVWCPKCNQNLRDSRQFLKLFYDSNKNSNRKTKTSYDYLKKASAIILMLIGAFTFHFGTVVFVYTLDFLNYAFRPFVFLGIGILLILLGFVIFGWNHKRILFKYVFFAAGILLLVSLSAILIYDSLVASLPKPFYIPVNSNDYKELIIGIALFLISSFLVIIIAKNGINYKNKLLKSIVIMISVFFILGVVYSMLSWPNITEPYWFTSRSIHKTSSSSQLYYRDRYAVFENGHLKIPVQSLRNRRF